MVNSTQEKGKKKKRRQEELKWESWCTGFEERLQLFSLEGSFHGMVPTLGNLAKFGLHFKHPNFTN